MDAVTTENVAIENEAITNNQENVEETPTAEAEKEFPMVNFLIITPAGETIPLNYVNLMENTSYIKQSLSEFIETCGYTHYSFEFRPEGKDTFLLSDFAELGAYFGEYVGQTVTLYMVTQFYEIKSARAHVKRTRDILSYPPHLKGVLPIPKETTTTPSSSAAATSTAATTASTTATSTTPTTSTSVATPETTQEAVPETTPETTVIAEEKTEPSPEPEVDIEAGERKEKSLEEMKATIERVKAALPTDGDIFTANGVSLKDYYQEVLYRVSENPDTAAHSSHTPADSIRSIFYSGWNPPPPPRKLRGDLFYLEVHFNVSNAPSLHITAQNTGFYINKSTTTVFDPTPASNANFSHELLDTLIASSPAISQSWKALSKSINDTIKKYREDVEEDITTSKANALESVAALYAQGRGDLVAQVPEWTSRPVEGNRKNKNVAYDMSRAQDDLSDTFGIEEKGALREWNEEIQTVRQLPVKDISEYLMKTRYSQRITQEFVEACKIAVVAICNGHIVSVNPMDDPENQVYMYNNIFFSRPVDVRETFKVTQGDEASRKVAGHDLKNQRLIQALNIEGLHTVLTAIVDYRGQRWIGQSVIPGILQSSENAARLMYGILEDGARIKCKTPAFEIMKQIGTSLSLAERNVPAIPATLGDAKASSKVESQNALLGFLASGDSQHQVIRVDDLDEVTEPDSTSIPHIGPLEGKILRGSDGRLYALEMTRLTPRDANYVKTKGTGKISDSDLDIIGDNICVSYVIRDELIDSYKSTRTLQLRQEELIKSFEKMKEESKLEEDEKKKKKIEDQQAAEGGVQPPTSDEVTEDAEHQANIEQNAAKKMFSLEAFEKFNSIHMELVVNPNVFLHTPCEVDNEKITADEGVAKDLALFLWECVLSNVTEIIRLGEEAPYDGKSLTHVLHRRGVNMRYLGELSRRARAEEEIDRQTQLENQKRKNPMPVYWQDLIEVEIIARCMKHFINSHIGDESTKIPPPLIISHIFNLLFGNGEIVPEIDISDLLISEKKSTTTTTNKKKKNHHKKSSKGGSKEIISRVAAAPPTPEMFHLSKIEFWKKYTELAKAKFLHYDSVLVVENPVTSDAYRNGQPFAFSQRLSKLSILRRICQICGIRIQCKDYDWSIPSPFTEADIYDIVPLVKSCEPKVPVPEVKVLLEESKVLLAQGQIGAAYERAQDASKYISQVVGPVHEDSSHALASMYAILVRIGDMKSALSTLTKKLTVDVQLCGLDSAETLQNHLNISLVYQEVGNYLAAASHIRSAVYILRLLCGDQHPEIATIYLRLSGIYNEVGNIELAFKCLKIAKELVYLNGDQGTHALICQNMAGLHSQFDNFKEAITLQKESYSILRQLFGETDTRTADAKVRFEILIRKSGVRNEQKAEREKKGKDGADSLWLDNLGAKKTKKSNKGKSGKKK